MPSFRIDDLRYEYHTNPIGVHDARPRLSWKLRPSQGKADGLRQGSYHILVASSPEQLEVGRADIWDSGEVKSGQSVFVDYGGPALQRGQRVWWTVRVTDHQGNAADLPSPAFWEAGLQRQDWQGQWIGSGMVGSALATVPVPMLRQTFEVPLGRQVKSARAYATALGLYELRLNGQRVGDHVLAPGWTDYRHRVRYQAYDVTSLVRGGENAIGLLLGDGWYCGNTGIIGRRQYYGDRPKGLVQLEVTLDDDSVVTVATDGSWRVAQSPITASDMFMGESYDARLEQPGWDAPGFAEDERWSAVTTFEDPGMAIVPMTGPPIRAVMELTPVEPPSAISNPWCSAIYRFDFGQNLVGGVRLKVKGSAGTTVTIRLAEVLNPDGTLYTPNLRGAKQTDSYTLRGDPKGEVFETRFTFHGFRYATIGGLSDKPTAETLTAIVLHSDMPKIGTFECSEPLVNQLCHNIEWGQRGNFLDVPTDCPQRDERLGWTGDAQVFARTAAFNFDVSGFFAKWTQDLRDAQGPLGAYPPVVPNNNKVRVENDIEYYVDGGPAWSDAGVICPWTMLLCYGDRKLIAEHYDSMVKFVERLRTTAEPYGLIRAHPDWAGYLGYGDWLSQDGKDGLFGSTPKDLIGTAFLAYDADLLAQMADLLGKKEDAKRYQGLADQTRAAFCRRYVTSDGLVVGNTQTAYLLALHFNLLPADLRPMAVSHLVRNIQDNGNRLNTGFVGSPYLNQVLTAGGRLDVAYTLLMQKQWPSWLYAVTHDATTIWERWDGWTHDRGFQDPGMNSFNHYAYGAIGAWLYHQCAGLDADEQQPGYQRLKFHPHPLVGGPLNFARATLQTPYGHAESGWTLQGTKLTYTVVVPPNTTAVAHIPAADATKVTCSGKPLTKTPGVTPGSQKEGSNAVVELAPGQYQFEAELSPAPPVPAPRKPVHGHEG